MELLKRNSTALPWFFLSLIPLTLYFLGAFNTSLTLFEKANINNAKGIVQGDVVAKINVVNDEIVGTCEVSGYTNSNICGVRYSLSQSLDDGLDLSDYESLRFTISTTSPSDPHSVRLQLRNFNSEYSSVSDHMSLKYQGVTIDTFENETTYSIALNDFHVESWWLFMYHLGMKNSATDFSNVPEVIVIHNGLIKPGIYSISMRGVYAEGKLVQLHTILALTMLAWLCILIAVLIHYDRAIKHRLHTDTLTQLQNRSGIKEFLRAHIKYRQSQPQLGLIYIDLDNFKGINDTYGHDVGDKVLQTFSDKTGELLKKCINNPEKYCFARMSGDEFALLISTRHKSTINYITEKLHHLFEKPMMFGNQSIELSFSIGVAFEKVLEQQATDLFAHADAAMYVAKSAGKSTSKSYENDLDNSTKLVKAGLEHFETAFLNDKQRWQFIPLCHLKTKSLDIVEVCVSTVHMEVIQNLLLNVPNKVHQRQATEKINSLVFSQFEIFYQQYASWFIENNIKVIFTFPDTPNMPLGFSERGAKQLCQSNIHNPLLALALNSAQGIGGWKKLVDIQVKTNTAHIQITPTNFMHEGTDLKLIEVFEVKTVQYSKSYVENHFDDGHLSDQFVAFTAYLKTYGIMTICDDYASDLNEMEALDSAGIDYVKGFLLESTYDIEELKRFKMINQRYAV